MPNFIKERPVCDSYIDFHTLYSDYLLKLLSFRAVIIGEVANFVAYAFAPAVLVTPLGALSIIVR